MNDNGRPNDPQSASQFGIPALTRLIIDQFKNRVDGEYLPQIHGDYLRVEYCDYPSRVSFNNTGYDQSIPLCSGLIVEGNFNGVTIWHDNLTTFTGLAKPQIILNLGRGKKLSVDNQNGKTGIPIPSNNSLIVTGFTLFYPVPEGYKTLTLVGVVGVTNAATPNACIVRGQFFDALGNVLAATGGLTKNSILYSSISQSLEDVLPPVQILATGWAFKLNASIPIPSKASSFQLVGSYSAVTSTDTARIAAFAS